MSERKSKRGKVYYSCTGYPGCKFMSWDIPTGERCEKCGEPLVQTARGKVKCSNRDCGVGEKSEKAEKTEKTTKKTSSKSTKKSAVEFTDGFEAPPLMDEPQYFGFEDIGNE